MSTTIWLLVAGGLWLVVVGTLRICASALKDVDRAQSELLAAGRRARLAGAEPRHARVARWRSANGGG